MRRLVVSQFVTVDGVMEGPGGDPGFDRAGWAFRFERGEDGDRFKLEEIKAAGALLLGRVTYEGFAAAWPSRTDDAGYADTINGMPKYVVSTTLDKAGWNNSTVIGADVATEVTRLKQEPGGDLLVFGSTRLVRSLIEFDLVDEYRLMVFPIVLGAGRRLFPDTGRIAPLRLVEARPLGSDGVTITTYRPAADRTRA